MTDEKKSDEKINWNRTVLVCIIVFVVVVGSINLMMYHDTHHIQLSEIAREKLNQGYTMACTERDGMDMCLVNATGNVLFEPYSNNNTEIVIWDKTGANSVKTWYGDLGKGDDGVNGQGFEKTAWHFVGTTVSINELKHTDQLWVIWRGF